MTGGRQLPYLESSLAYLLLCLGFFCLGEALRILPLRVCSLV